MLSAQSDWLAREKNKMAIRFAWATEEQILSIDEVAVPKNNNKVWFNSI